MKIMEDCEFEEWKYEDWELREFEDVEFSMLDERWACANVDCCDDIATDGTKLTNQETYS